MGHPSGGGFPLKIQAQAHCELGAEVKVNKFSRYVSKISRAFKTMA